MTVDWSFRLGDILSFVGFALGGLSVIYMMRSDINALGIKLGFLKETVDEQKDKIEAQNKEIARFGELIHQMGRYEERFLGLQRQIDEMKRGEGLIVRQK